MTPGNRRVKTPAVLLPFDSDGTFGEPPEPRGRWSGVLSVAGTVFGVILVCAISTGVAWVGRRYLLRSQRFSITEVEVHGEEHRDGAAIAAESGLTVGANIFSVDLDVARARLLGDPWIAEATVVRRLPGTLVVSVSERKPAALVALGDTFLATDDGTPFERMEPGDAIDLPLVTGVEPAALAQDRAGAVRTIRRAIELAAEFDHGPLAKRFPLQEIHVSPEGTFAIVAGHMATELVLGGPPFRRKLEQAARIVTELDRRGAKAEALLMDNDSRPDRVVVRMR